ncbi:hypothetical protein J6TS2_28300 [Heyndrickxia sporothermodurans]|nr:hypothetical protein J6TS2_28300 [Heyndrickxia sporothermodurans]
MFLRLAFTFHIYERVGRDMQRMFDIFYKQENRKRICRIKQREPSYKNVRLLSSR